MTIRSPTPEESEAATLAMRQQFAAPYVRVLWRALDWCVENPDRFSKYSPAADETGKAVLPLDPAAVKFCFFGRIAVEAGIKLDWLVSDETGHADKLINGEPLQDWLGMVDVSPMAIIDAYRADSAMQRNTLLRIIIEDVEARYDA